MMELAELKRYLAQKLPRLTEDKTHLFIINGGYQDGYLDYTARLLFLDCRGDPIMILAIVKNWLKQKNRHLNPAGTDIQISFSTEVIDIHTFDLEIDFPQRDKINLTDEGYNICEQHVWDEQLGFVAK